MRARGFTLLEVMVALSVLATALVALLSLHARNIQIVGDDRQIVRATLLAQAAMTEILLAEPFPEIGERGGEFEEDPGFAWRAEFLGPGVPELAELLREVRVRVFWGPEDADGVELVTLVRRPDS
jgi:general secretion pathway protein I